MDHLAELQEAIRDASDPMVVMRRIVDQTLLLIPAADGAVVELAHDGWLTYVCAGGTLSEHVGTRLPLRDSLSGLAMRTGKTLCCHDSTTDARVDARACRAVGALSMVCVPLRHDDRSIGVLKVSAARAHAFTDADADMLASLAEFITVAIASASDLARIASGKLPAASAMKHSAADGARDVVTGLTENRHASVSAFMANVLRPGLIDDLSTKERIERVLAQRRLMMHCQPIVRLDTAELVGAEALARFPGPPQQTPDVWFSEADAVGLGAQLQLAAVEAALALAAALPKDAFLAFNIGPEAISAPR